MSTPLRPPRIPPSIAPRDEALAPEPEAPIEEAPALPPRRAWRRILQVLLWTFVVLFVLALVPPGVVLALRWKAPPTTAFMLQSETQPVQYQWVPAGQIPETLRLAAVAAEDQKFWTHWGFDFIAIAEALEHNEKNRKKRGASTITQQTAKNLFLWPSRSWTRKGLEVTFTLLLEGLWPKERILEVYLNIAEFGPGIYGVEAAARNLFGKPARDLTPTESARLIAVLPNPRKWSAEHPGPYVQRRVDWILARIGYGPPAAPEIEEPIPPGPTPGELPLEPEAPVEPEFGEPAPPEPAPENTGEPRDQSAEPAPAPDTPAETETPAADAAAPAEAPPPP